MRLHEHQSKQFLASFGIAIPKGRLVDSVEGARSAAQELGGAVVVKAQVHAGGRGRAGGVVFAATADEAAEIARRLLGSRLRTTQSDPQGLPVAQLLLEQPVAVERELYLALLLDPSRHRPVCIASAQGGMAIEELASAAPEELTTVTIDPLTGVHDFQMRTLTSRLHLGGGLASQLAHTVRACYRLMVDRDCSSVEINPLVVTAEGRLVALDAKVSVDDSALFRQPEIKTLRDDSQITELEREAHAIGVSYVKLPGNIGCLVNGAGLAMATMDLVKSLGGEPANFLDVGGSADEETIGSAIRLLLSDRDVKVAWINIFGGILRCDTVARALMKAQQSLHPSIMFVVRMRGTNAEEAARILTGGPMSMMLEADLSRAARLAVASAMRQ